jgi:hypothetical protein
VNSQYLTAIFDDELLVGLQGGRGRISRGAGVPLRKAAVGTLTGLVKVYLYTYICIYILIYIYTYIYIYTHIYIYIYIYIFTYM